MANLLYLLLWKVDTCCGFDLRMGAKIILWIEFICSALMVVVSTGYILISEQRMKDLLIGNFDEAVYNSLIVNNLVFGLLPSFLAWWGDRKNYPSCLRLYIVIQLLDVIRFFASILIEFFIWMCEKNGPTVVDMFIILSHGSSEVFCLLCVLLFELVYVIELRRSKDVVYFFCAVIFYTIQWYWVSVIYKHYLNMKRGRNAKQLAGVETSVPSSKNGSIAVDPKQALSKTRE